MTTRNMSFERTSRNAASGRSAARSASDQEPAAPARGNPSHEQIAARAREIWQAKGCPADRDHENWREAEEQLRGMSG